MTNIHQELPENVSATAQLGQELRILREQKNLSIVEVADRLKLPVRQIEALENGLYEGLPEPIFIRGFLRSYGRFLDMDETHLANLLDQIAPPNATQNHATKHNLNYANTAMKKASPKWIWAVVALALIGTGVYLWQIKSNSENEKQDNISTIPDNHANVVSPNLNSENLLVKPMTASDTATETATASAVMPAPNSHAAAILAASVPAVPSVTGELMIATKHRTMLTVTDVHGKVLMNKIVPANSEYRFKEGAPFDVRMGYATGATVTFAGQPISLEDKQKDGKSVAFTAGALPASVSAPKP